MKAAVLYGNRDIRYTDYEEPTCRPGCVKIAVRATGICGSDVPRVLHNGAHYYPIILGHEFSGVVTEVGEGVKKVEVGQTVSGAPLIPCMQCEDCQKGNYALCKHYSFVGSRENGSFAEYVVIPEQNAIPYDPAIGFEQAAMFEPATVALHGLFVNGYRGGESVAILGGGTIGLFTMQWAKIFGAKQVVVFDLVKERLDLALRLGADAVVNTADADFLKEAAELTNGKGFGMVFETAGNPVTVGMGFRLAANRAHYCCIGNPHRELTFAPDLWEQMNRKEFSLTGSWMSYSAPFPGKEWELTAHYFKTGELRFDPALIYRTYPMKEVADAFSLFLDPASVKGKVMLINP